MVSPTEEFTVRFTVPVYPASIRPFASRAFMAVSYTHLRAHVPSFFHNINLLFIF